MSGKQRCFGIVVFGEYPAGADVYALDVQRVEALAAFADQHGATAEYLDQKGVGEWLADAVEEGLSR